MLWEILLIVQYLLALVAIIGAEMSGKRWYMSREPDHFSRFVGWCLVSVFCTMAAVIN